MDAQQLTPRQREIVRLVAEQSYATLEGLAQRFEVSIQSIRRDVIQLDRLRLLQRFHGGAGATQNTVRLGHREKRVTAADAKARIGQAGARLVPPGASAFLDVGTTTEALARALAEREAPLRVFTNSLSVGLELAGRSHVELHVFGGTARGADGSLAGAATLSALDAVSFDIAFIGCSGLDEEARVTDYDLEKIAVKRLAMRRAGASILLADASKFSRRATVAVAPLGDFAHVVTSTGDEAVLRERVGPHAKALTIV